MFTFVARFFALLALPFVNLRAALFHARPAIRALPFVLGLGAVAALFGTRARIVPTASYITADGTTATSFSSGGAAGGGTFTGASLDTAGNTTLNVGATNAATVNVGGFVGGQTTIGNNSNFTDVYLSADGNQLHVSPFGITGVTANATLSLQGDAILQNVGGGTTIVDNSGGTGNTVIDNTGGQAVSIAPTGATGLSLGGTGVIETDVFATTRMSLTLPDATSIIEFQPNTLQLGANNSITIENAIASVNATITVAATGTNGTLALGSSGTTGIEATTGALTESGASVGISSTGTGAVTIDSSFAGTVGNAAVQIGPANANYVSLCANSAGTCLSEVGQDQDGNDVVQVSGNYTPGTDGVLLTVGPTFQPKISATVACGTGGTQTIEAGAFEIPVTSGTLGSECVLDFSTNAQLGVFYLDMSGVTLGATFGVQFKNGTSTKSYTTATHTSGSTMAQVMTSGPNTIAVLY